jgi:hypothetical protein
MPFYVICPTTDSNPLTRHVGSHSQCPDTRMDTDHAPVNRRQLLYPAEPVEEAKAEIAEMQQVLEEIETTYNNVHMNGGSTRRDREERASVTSADTAGLEAVANGVSEDGDYVDVLEQDGGNDPTPSKSRTCTRSPSYDRRQHLSPNNHRHSNQATSAPRRRLSRCHCLTPLQPPSPR